MSKAIVPYLGNCTGCRFCEMACSLHHENVLNFHKSRIRIVKRGVQHDIPIVCNQGNACNQECVEACPVDCIRVVNGICLDVIREECIGCRQCVDACPYDSIHMMNGYAIKCNLCNGDPMCIKFCPLEAILFQEGKEEKRGRKWTEARRLARG